MVKFICDTHQLDMLGYIQPDGSKKVCIYLKIYIIYLY